MSSCSKETNLYDSNLALKEYEQAWTETFGQVAADQDWNLATRATATISITEDALSTYNLQLFTANPLYDENAQLIANYQVKTDANGYASVTFNCDIAKSATQLYAVRMDSHKRRLVKLVDVTNGTIEASFGGTATTKAATRASIGSIEDMETTKIRCPYTEDNIKSKLNSYTDLSNYVWGTVNYKVVSDLEYDGYLNSYSGIQEIVIGNGGTLHVKKGKIENITIIVGEGGVLDITNASEGDNSAVSINCPIYIMKGGSLRDTNTNHTTSYCLNINSGKIYNYGTLEVPVINVNGGYWDNGYGLLYNGDTGVIKASTMYMQTEYTEFTSWGKAEFENIKGKGDNDDWGQGTVNNGCLLRVKDTFRAATLNLAANSSLECDTFRTNGKSTLRQGSIIRAENLYCTLAEYTYKGDDSQGALISVTNVKQFDNNNTLTGNIYFEVDSFDKLTGGDADWYQHKAEEATEKYHGISKIGEAPVILTPDDNEDIAKAGCSGKGNTPKETGGGGNEEGQSWIIACEDLGASDDVDFNDVVVKVSYVAGENKVYVTPLAAGGTLKSVISFPALSWSGEIHELLNSSLKGTASGSYPMLNTSGSGNTVDTNALEYKANKLPLGITENFTLTNSDGANNMGGFTITVDDKDGAQTTIGAPTVGSIPKMFVVPATWAWPTERTHITTAYPGFKDWVSDAADYNWYNSAE